MSESDFLKKMVAELIPIASAPRDGSTVFVGSASNGIFPMKWEPEAVHPVTGRQGIWVAIDGSFIWSEYEGDGPSGWRPIRLH